MSLSLRGPLTLQCANLFPSNHFLFDRLLSHWLTHSLELSSHFECLEYGPRQPWVEVLDLPHTV